MAAAHHTNGGAGRSATGAVQIGDLPAEVIERVARRLSSSLDLAAVNATSRLFRGAPGERSAVEHALRERSCARGHARALPAMLPAGVLSWTEELFARERLLELACAYAGPVAAGDGFSAFVDAEGGLHTCGELEEEDEVDGAPTGEYWAHLANGHPDAPAVRVPTRVTSLGAVRVRSLAAGRYHLLALSEAGAVYGCGLNCNGQLGLGDPAPLHTTEFVPAPSREVWACITAGFHHSLALTVAGCAYSWGDNYYSQLGHGDTEERWEPTRIEALDGVRVGGVAAGAEHTLLLSAHGGAVYSCGAGGRGALGHGDQRNQRTPRRIESLAGVRAVHVSAGAHHSLVVGAVGCVHSFGRGCDGALGYDAGPYRSVPKRVDALSTVRAVRACAGYYSSAVLGADGSVHAFGSNQYGQLGLGYGGSREYVPTRVPASAHARVLSCALGYDHALHATEDGCVHSCGKHSAALGHGRSAADWPQRDLSAPTRIEQLPPLHQRQCAVRLL